MRKCTASSPAGHGVGEAMSLHTVDTNRGTAETEHRVSRSSTCRAATAGTTSSVSRQAPASNSQSPVRRSHIASAHAMWPSKPSDFAFAR